MKLLHLLLLLIPIVTQAQSELSDPEATRVLDKVSKSISTFDQLEIRFDLLVKNPEIELERKEGVLFQDDEKVYVDIAQQIIINDGENVYILFKDDNTGQINSSSEGTEGLDMFNPRSFIEMYKTDDYIYGITGEEDYDGKRLLSIEFKPKDRYSAYSKLRLAIDEKNNLPYYIKFFNKDGSRITLVLKEFDTAPVFSKGQFEFDESKFPGIQLEDLRID